ncbi:hypothetical protein RUM44_013093 [Polyplax serrata]|uniref:LEM domain-containing protein n=1 Tax=Polyplax serrata TaxID=468196 RepID=A0ABR1BGW0_POLSC
MTIDQLKKSLTEQGITLPPSRSKKADYIKLYQQYSTINDSLGDVYSSDDENPPKTGSQSVTSSTSPGKSDNTAKEVELLSDDELYNQLKEYDTNIGPVLKNTRRVYEKRLIKILSSKKGSSNYDGNNGTEDSRPSLEEFSDSDVEVLSMSPKKSEIKTKRTSVPRDSPKPSSPGSVKPNSEKSFLSNYDFENRSSLPSYSSDTKTSRYSYIETIPKGSTFGYVEQSQEGDLGSDLRQRFTDKYNTNKSTLDNYSSRKYTNNPDSDDIHKATIDSESYKPGPANQLFSFGKGGDNKFKTTFGTQYKPTVGISNKSKSGNREYIGSWEPNVNRYLGTGTQKKVASKTNKYSTWLKNLIAVLALLMLLLFAIYLYQQWSTTDPYKMIEDDAERTIQQLNQGSGDGI